MLHAYEFMEFSTLQCFYHYFLHHNVIVNIYYHMICFYSWLFVRSLLDGPTYSLFPNRRVLVVLKWVPQRYPTWPACWSAGPLICPHSYIVIGPCSETMSFKHVKHELTFLVRISELFWESDRVSWDVQQKLLRYLLKFRKLRFR